tara:strand:+ start:155 stop:739 length:585 start_codon:yes stop_codon:yes gene_type:complete
MKSPYCFIVEPKDGMRYDNISHFGNKKLIKSVSQEDHTATNRFATVLSVPLNYDGKIKAGDVLIVHHNVFRKYYDMKGREKSGPCHFKDNTYIIERDQIYLYLQNDKWNAVDPYCFIKPIEKIQNDLLSLETEEKETGVLFFINDELKKLGLNKGDRVSFLPESEYEFNISGEKLYRMRTRNITVKLSKWTQEN